MKKNGKKTLQRSTTEGVLRCQLAGQLKLNKKGQTIMIDLMIAIVVFVIAVFFLFNMYEDNKKNIIEQQTMVDLQEKASQVSDVLVRSGGIPENWETLSLSDVNVIGLAKKDRKY